MVNTPLDPHDDPLSQPGTGAEPRGGAFASAASDPPLDSAVASPAPALASAAAAPAHRGLWARVSWRKIGLFLVSLFLFILALNLMKEGARGLAPLVRDSFRVTNPANSLGFGWLFAYVVMSGSPVAAAALTFFDAGAITQLETFTMITGSRMGASFIVLFIGFIYVLRGRSRLTSLSMGLTSLTVTWTTYLVGLVIGIFLLQNGVLDSIQMRTGALLNSVLDLIFDPMVSAVRGVLPRWALFLVGMGVILVSFNLFDRCLPEMSLKESQVGRVSRVIYRPWVMFLLGAGVTTISMSVSVSLGILVPLSNRGFVRRENVIPYIMGANITTFIDTLFAAVLLNNPPAFTVVLTEMISIALVSVFILLFVYRAFERASLRLVATITASGRNLAIFMVILFSVPILLMLV
ncbi:MAG: hypothetical protein NZ528_16545 [Caldilineales bacterium]|nr:hypothetical protein [Caldilineales bacterium]MDW8317984.1 hypothetical protein [Anaerolineae bacterium]